MSFKLSGRAKDGKFCTPAGQFDLKSIPQNQLNKSD